MTKRNYLFFIIGMSALVGTVIAIQTGIGNKNSVENQTSHDVQNNTNVSGSSSLKQPYSLAFFLNIDNPYYETNLEIFIKNLKKGDYLLVSGPPERAKEIIQKTHEIQNLVNSGVNVFSVMNYKKISDIVATVPTLPKGVDYVMYDYEGGNGYSPEFTTDENQSIVYFDKAHSAVEMYNKNTGSHAKLFVTPPYGQLHKLDWNWDSVVTNMDVVDMQLQAFLKDPSLKNYTINIMQQIHKTSPDKLVFIQLSITPKRGTVLDNVSAIDNLKNVSGIGAFLIFYQNTQSSDLKQFFNIIQRDNFTGS